MKALKNYTEIRKREGRTNTWVCNQMGRSQMTLWNWEEGRKSPSKGDLTLLCSILNTTEEELRGE